MFPRSRLSRKRSPKRLCVLIPPSLPRTQTSLSLMAVAVWLLRPTGGGTRCLPPVHSFKPIHFLSFKSKAWTLLLLFLPFQPPTRIKISSLFGRKMLFRLITKRQIMGIEKDCPESEFPFSCSKKGISHMKMIGVTKCNEAPVYY